MDMRAIIDLFEGSLNEAKSYELEIKRSSWGNETKDITIYENPTQKDMVRLCQKYPALDGGVNLRGFVANGKTFVWDAQEATHTTVQRALNFEENDSYDFYQSPNVANFHVRGYGWQEGDLNDRNFIIIKDLRQQALVQPLVVKWNCQVSDRGYF